MLSVDIALPEVEELQKLVEQGQEKGFLTYDEITTALEDVELTKEQIEDFTAYVVDHSIELVEGEQHKSLPFEQAPVVPEEEAKVAPPKLDSVIEGSNVNSFRLDEMAVSKSMRNFVSTEFCT